MMTEEERIEWLLELQEHPEQLTDDQLKQILADDEMRQLVQQLGFAKRAFKHDELTNEREQNDACINSVEQEGRRLSQLKNDIPEVEGQWEKFAASHANELDALDEGEHKPRFLAFLAPHKIAASFIGVLLASGIAFAAIQVVRNISTSKPQLPTTEQTTDIEPVTSRPVETVKADTIPAEPCVFNNVPLDSMLTAIAAAHGVQVEFENDAARGLRFHFVWKREDSLARIAEKLNTFDAVNIVVEDKKLIVR
ncbi:MAG: DUF4974 domain-containing protein [Bacteroidaceae bacterium]|nr:DUF4974 domain-containing protein [Bacteroidaceae bacterium]